MHLRRVFDGNEARLAVHHGLERAAGPHELARPASGLLRRAAPGPELVLGQIANREQEVVHAIDVGGRAGEALQRARVVLEDLRIEQAAQLRFAEELAQPREVEGERLRPPLRGRRVGVVDEGGYEREEHARRKRRRSPGVDGRDTDAPRRDVAQQRDRPGQIERVAEALAVRLEHDGEARVLRGHREEVLRALALRPEGRAPAGIAPGEQERACRALAEASGEERRAVERARDDVLDGVCRGQEEVDRWGFVAGRDAKRHAVVGVVKVHLDVALSQPSRDRDGPRRDDAHPQRAHDDHPPVAHAVHEPLHDEGAITRDLARRGELLLHVTDERVHGFRVDGGLGL